MKGERERRTHKCALGFSIQSLKKKKPLESLLSRGHNTFKKRRSFSVFNLLNSPRGSGREPSVKDDIFKLLYFPLRGLLAVWRVETKTKTEKAASLYLFIFCFCFEERSRSPREKKCEV